MNITCLCGAKLNTNLNKFRCSKCKTEFEYIQCTDIIEPKHKKIRGYLGREYNYRKLKRYIKVLDKIRGVYGD